MKIIGKVHCFFEQSGTFKNEFIKLGIPAEDYDIQDNFGQTDHVIDLFENIQKSYEGGGKRIRQHKTGRFNFSVFPLYLFLRDVANSVQPWMYKLPLAFGRREGGPDNRTLEAPPTILRNTLEVLRGLYA